jgi:hypothetical protein
MEENQQQDNQAQMNQPPVSNTPPTGVNTAVSTSDGPNGPFPQELNKWNWGAFLLSWIWSIGNSVWIGLLVLLSFIPVIGPIISLVMVIMLGIKGNEWAWKAKKWDSVEHFKTVQAKWKKWGIILVVGSIAVAFILGILFAVMMVSISKNASPAVNSQYSNQTTVNSSSY